MLYVVITALYQQQKEDSTLGLGLSTVDFSFFINLLIIYIDTLIDLLFVRSI